MNKKLSISANENKVTFRAPLASRLLMALLTLLFIAGPVLIIVINSRGKPMSVIDFQSLGLYEVLVGLPLGLIMFYLTGPNDLFIDLDQRTYRQIYGWLYAPTIRSGQLGEDIAGVYVRSIQGYYHVGLIWKRNWKPGQKWFYVIKIIYRSSRADRLAEEIASVLKLPLVEPPFLKS